MTAEKKSVRSEQGCVKGDHANGKLRGICHKVRVILKHHSLFLLTLVCIFLGFILGFTIRTARPSKEALMWLGFPGEIFLRLLKMMILPLIVSGVIAGTSSLDPKSNGKISGIALGYIVATNIVGCVFGIFLSLTIKPGRMDGRSRHVQRSMDTIIQTPDIFADLIRNIFPDNIMQATMQQARTTYQKRGETVLSNISQGNESHGLFNVTMIRFSRQLSHTDGANILGLIFCCLMFGIASSVVGDKAKPFKEFFLATMEITIKILRWFFWYSPIGIASLIAVAVAGIHDLQATFSQLGLFVLTVSLGIIIHQILIIPIIHLATTKSNPFLLFRLIIKAWLLGFAATSTAVTIPEMFHACDKHKIDKRVSRFVIPFCVTLNADGSALFIAASAIFLSQRSSIPLDPGQVITIGVLTAVASMALPSVPSSSIVTIIVILTSLSLPTSDIALLFASEWLLDRIRTTSNIVSHTFCAAFTNHLCKKNLQHCDETSDKDIPNEGIEIDLDSVSLTML